jgi:hypothetical protein
MTSLDQNALNRPVASDAAQEKCKSKRSATKPHSPLGNFTITTIAVRPNDINYQVPRSPDSSRRRLAFVCNALLGFLSFIVIFSCR